MVKSTYTPSYIEGLKEIHLHLLKMFKESIENLSFFFTLPDKFKSNLISWKEISLFVDFYEEQPQDGVKAYLFIQSKIFRFISFNIDYVVLFPVTDHNSGPNGNYNFNGITYEELSNLKRKRSKIVIHFKIGKKFSAKSPILEKTFKEIDLSKTSELFEFESHIDDVGKPYYKFSDVTELKLTNVPQQLLNKRYSLVGKQFYAPLTINREIYCVLFAELDNKYDDKAIKVLRWFPMTREKWIDRSMMNNNYTSDVFFELGHVSRQENQELHDFMVSKSSRLLFGKVINNEITILGGIKIFLSNDLNYPLCLSQIPVK